MSTTTGVDALAARIHAIDWDGDPGRTRSRVALMREYLRRSALWTRALGAKGWPFHDIAQAAAPGVRAAPEVVAGVLESPVVAERYPLVGRSCVWALHLAAARDAGAALPGLPDPFEPLIRMYERGGGFSLSTTGTIDVGAASLYRGTLLDHLGDEPRAPETDAGLDALDGAGGTAVSAAPGAPARPDPVPRADTPLYPSAAYALSAPPAPPPGGAPPGGTLPAGGPVSPAAPAPAAPYAPPPPGYRRPRPGAPAPAHGYPPPGHSSPYAGPPPPRPGLRHHTHWNPQEPARGLAEPGYRFLARVLDTVVAGVLWFLSMLATTFTAVIIGGGDIVMGEGSGLAFQVGAVFSFLLFPILWEWFQVGLWGRSVGKMLLGLWVVRAEGGGRLPAGRALVRALCFAPGFTNAVNWLLPWSLANVLWSLPDKRLRRCLHDRAARSVVVHVPWFPGSAA